MAWVLRAHHLINLKQYVQDKTSNEVFEFAYGQKNTLGSELIFEDILAGESVEVIIGEDCICRPYCKARRKKCCYISDGNSTESISHKEIEQHDRETLEKLAIQENKIYSSKEILKILNP